MFLSLESSTGGETGHEEEADPVADDAGEGDGEKEDRDDTPEEEQIDALEGKFSLTVIFLLS